ncbi:MAG: tetratricopeptide repeat protein, partial [Planctomycetota bacterium]
MRTRWLRALGAAGTSVVLGIALLSLPGTARADSKADARRYFQRGMSLIESGRYDEGIEQLQKAYKSRPHPNVLFNIARAYAVMGALNRAIDYFEQYLASNPPDSSRVRSTLNELRTRRRLRRWVNDGMLAIREGRYLEGVGL